MKLFKTNKITFSVKNNAAEFLNGLTSNTLEAPNNAFLDIHGKIVVTFDQLKVGDDEFLILIEKGYEDDLFKHIDRYVKLSKVQIERQDYHVYFDLEGDAKITEGDYTLDQKKGRLIVTKNELDTDVSDEEFTVFRLKNNIPIHGIDYKDEMLLNVSMTDFVSFTKGCFLGQEPVSKVYNRSKPTWRLLAKNKDQCDGSEKGEMTSVTLDPESQKMLGFVFVRNTD